MTANEAEAMRIDSSGNVGIGETSIDADLHITEALNVTYSASAVSGTTNNQAFLKLQNTQTSPANPFVNIHFRTDKSGADGFMAFTEDGTNSGFFTWGHDNTEYMRLDASGNVGIGVTNPNHTLHVKSSDTSALKIQRDSTSGGDGAYLNFGISTNDSITQASIIAYRVDGDEADLAFNTGANAGTEAMRIDSSGNVTMPNQPAFQVTNSSDHTNISNSAETTHAFDTEVFDQGANFATNTFTAPVTGKYQLTYHLYIQSADSDATTYNARIVTSNRTYIRQQTSTMFDSDGTMVLVITVLADMDTSDTAHCTYHQSGGTSQSDVVTQSFFSGYLAC